MFSWGQRFQAPEKMRRMWICAFQFGAGTLAASSSCARVLLQSDDIACGYAHVQFLLLLSSFDAILTGVQLGLLLSGYKYWSCCKKKKTTDFSEFLTFTGCTRGICTFVDDPTKKKKALCRYDFFQQGPTVTLSIYAKKVCRQLKTQRA